MGIYVILKLVYRRYIAFNKFLILKSVLLWAPISPAGASRPRLSETEPEWFVFEPF